MTDRMRRKAAAQSTFVDAHIQSIVDRYRFSIITPQDVIICETAVEAAQTYIVAAYLMQGRSIFRMPQASWRAVY